MGRLMGVVAGAEQLTPVAVVYAGAVQETTLAQHRKLNGGTSLKPANSLAASAEGPPSRPAAF